MRTSKSLPSHEISVLGGEFYGGDFGFGQLGDDFPRRARNNRNARLVDIGKETALGTEDHRFARLAVVLAEVGHALICWWSIVQADPG